MKLKSSEQAHMKELGSRWDTVFAACSLSVRLNPKLVGLDKIREPLATKAALKATGCETAFNVPPGVGQPDQEFQDIVDAAFAAAVKIGEAKFAQISPAPAAS